MSHEHETPIADSAAFPDASVEARPETGPDFLERAKRILGGDIHPEDYLPVTPEVEARVQRDLGFATDRVRKQFEAKGLPAVFEFDPCVAIRQRNQWLLSLYYGGQNIACIENDNGVIVLAVGLDQSAAVINAFPYEQRKDVMLDTPPFPDVIEIY